MGLSKFTVMVLKVSLLCTEVKILLRLYRERRSGEYDWNPVDCHFMSWSASTVSFIVDFVQEVDYLIYRGM